MGKAADARDAESQAEIDEIDQQLTGLPQAIASNDGRKADTRPITDRDIENHVPAHVAENYAAVVAEQHDGDWSALAARFDQAGDVEAEAGRPANVRSHRVLAAWARKQDSEKTPVVESDAAPKGRTAPVKSTT